MNGSPNGIDRGPRRAFLRGAAGACVAGLAGCVGAFPGTGEPGGDGGRIGLSAFRGSGPMVVDRPAPGGTSMDDLPPLEGELTLYLGGGEGGLYVDLIELIERKNEGFTVNARTNSSAALANTIVEETRSGTSPADVFLSIDAGSLGVVNEAGATRELPAAVLDPVPTAFRDPGGRWVGLEGRARTIPYNPKIYAPSDIPASVMSLPEVPAFADAMGWAPTYGAFQSFVTAMRLLEGEAATRDWLEGMLAAGVEEYPDEFLVSNAVADAEIDAGFANHYYALRVKAARPNAPIELAFTRGDAGALVNVSGATVVRDTDVPETAADFIRYLLSAEAQEFFATVTFGYPVVPDVAPIGDLPTIDELAPPDIDLAALSDLQPTLQLMRDVGVL